MARSYVSRRRKTTAPPRGAVNISFYPYSYPRRSLAMFISLPLRLTVKPYTAKFIDNVRSFLSLHVQYVYVHVLTLDTCVYVCRRGSRGVSRLLGNAEEERGEKSVEEKRFGVLVRRTLKRLYHRARSLASLISWLARRPRGRLVREFNLCANRGERVYA